MLNKKIFFIFFFAFVIRLIALNQSLWLDEAVTAKVVMTYNFSDIVSKFSPTDFHPPLYYLFMKSWTNIFGYSEIALRMPSVLFSLMTGYVVYLIGGMWAASFFLFNPLIVYYSQEARMYLMTTFLLTMALWSFWGALATPESDSGQARMTKNYLLFNVSIILALLTFYGSIFLISAMLLYLLFKKEYKNFFISCLSIFIFFLLMNPLLYQQLLNSKIALASVANWSLVLGKANIKNLLLIPIKFSIGRISFYPKLIYWIISGIWVIVVFWKIFLGGLKNRILLFLFIFPLILGFVVSFFTPMLQYFRFIYLIPIMAILLAKKNVTPHHYGVTFGFMIFSLAYLLFPQFHREDWKSLVHSLPKDKPVYMIPSSSDPVRYYSNTLTIKGLSQVNKLEKEIIVIPYTADIHGLDYKTSLSKAGYQLKKEVSFREVTYEQWSLLE